MPDRTHILRVAERPVVFSTDAVPSAPPTLLRPDPETSALPQGVVVPGYELLGELGRGGMGVVYKARQKSLNRLVALKVLIGGAFAGAVEKARFRLEAEAVARFHHPNVVQVYDVGDHLGVEYIAFEFVDGPTIRRWQEGKPVEARLAARLAADIAHAVQHAHDSGIVHRDLKPANILLSADCGTRNAERKTEDESGLLVSDSAFRTPHSALQPKVTDFGLAKPMEGGTDLTITGMACGTPNYMAPEQVRGGAAAGRLAVDIWGIGAVLFELLTGRPPFTGTDAATIMRDILLCEPPAVRKFVPNVPRDLGVIVAKCLDKDPTRRYLTAAAVAEDLGRFLANEPILARPIGTAQMAARWLRRNPLPTALGLVLFLGLAGMSAFAFALDRSVDRERAALDEESRLRQEAVAARLASEEATRAAKTATQAAERANDETQAALERLKTTTSNLRIQNERAEDNLILVRRAVRHVVETLEKHSPDDEPAFAPLYRELLTGFQPFLERFVGQKSGDVELRFEQASIARTIGLLERNLGRPADARRHYLASVSILRELVREKPTRGEFRLALGHTLGLAGSVSSDLREPDAGRLLAEGLVELQKCDEATPKNPQVIDHMIRLRLALSYPPDAPHEHAFAVLSLTDQAEALFGPSTGMVMARAHALNNIASHYTNTGKTADAEPFWLRVLAIREAQVKADPNDRAARFELGKALCNYARQLGKTKRPDDSFRTRQRAATLFDTLRGDARFRTNYIAIIIQNDDILADEYAERGERAKAIEQITRGILTNAILLERDPTEVKHRAYQADAHTTRAGLHAAGGRHADAARDFRAAIQFSTKQSHSELCHGRLVVALARSGQREEAEAIASRLKPENITCPPACLELARGCALLAKAVNDDVKLVPVEQAARANAMRHVGCAAINRLKASGAFDDPDFVKWFREQSEFEAYRELVPVAKK